MVSLCGFLDTTWFYLCYTSNLALIERRYLSLHMSGNMDSSTTGAHGALKVDDEKTRYAKRVKLRELNTTTVTQGWWYLKG